MSSLNGPMIFDKCIDQIDSKLRDKAFAIRIGKQGKLLVLDSNGSPIKNIPKDTAISSCGSAYQMIADMGNNVKIKKFGFQYERGSCMQYVSSKLMNLIQKDGLYCRCSVDCSDKSPFMYNVSVFLFSYTLSCKVNVEPYVVSSDDRNTFCEKATKAALDALKNLEVNIDLVKESLINRAKSDCLSSAMDYLDDEGFKKSRINADKTIFFTFNNMSCCCKSFVSDKCFEEMFIVQEDECYKYINSPRFTFKFKDDMSRPDFEKHLASCIAENLKQQEYFPIIPVPDIPAAVVERANKARNSYNKAASVLLVGTDGRGLIDKPKAYISPQNGSFLYDYGCFTIKYDKKKKTAALRWSEQAKAKMERTPAEKQARAMINKLLKDSRISIYPADKRFKGLLSEGDRKISVQYCDLKYTIVVHAADCRFLSEWEKSVIVPIEDSIDKLKKKGASIAKETEERMTVFKNSFLSSAIYNAVKANEACITANAVVSLLRGTKVALSADVVKTPESGTMNFLSKEDIVCEIDHMLHSGLLNSQARKGEFTTYYLLKCNKIYDYKMNTPKKLLSTSVTQLKTLEHKLSDVESESLILYFKDKETLKAGDYALMFKLLSDSFIILKAKTVAEVFKGCPDEIKEFISMKMEALDNRHLIKAYKAIIG